jgi:hypothetical protein
MCLYSLTTTPAPYHQIKFIDPQIQLKSPDKITVKNRIKILRQRHLHSLPPHSVSPTQSITIPMFTSDAE